VGGPLRIGVVGVGKISEQYLAEFPKLPGLKLVAVADLNAARAVAVASDHDVVPLTVGELVASHNVDAVLNLTVPAAHAAVALQALNANKHVYGEKPLALNPTEAASVLTLAAERGLRVGAAPDTVLGTGVQTARALLDSGRIGTPVAASAFWTAPGHELWHPDPQFYYSDGGGPLYDMGPYYLSALVTMLGPVVRVSGSVARSGRARTVATGPLTGTSVTVGVDTHVSALLEHASGVTSTLIMSFDVWAARLPRIEIYGTRGSIAVPDPNHFSDVTELFTSDDPRWREVPAAAGYADAGRGYGLADMARAIETNRPHRASAELAFHVLEIMDAILRAGHDHSVIEIASTTARPAMVPHGAVPHGW